ncbi:reverse transcriptase domain-containing protein [Tanacetum coccineum]
MIQYVEKVQLLASSFKRFSIKQVPRSENKKVDSLSKIASTSFAHLTKQVLVEELKEKSINEAKVLAVVEEMGDTCMHAGTRYVVAKAIRTGYYWPTMHMDARKMIRACQDCQVYRPVPRKPQQKLTPIMSPWPFYKWGIDIAGPFSEGPSKVKFLIVAMDYFTKWIEAKPLATMTGGQNDEALEINLDLLEERREKAAIREARSKAKMEKYYNSKVQNTSFKPRDPVYRNNDVSHAKDSGKLSPKWEGPYEVTEALGNRAHKLRDRNGKPLPRTWNVRNLKKCYVYEM